MTKERLRIAFLTYRLQARQPVKYGLIVSQKASFIIDKTFIASIAKV
jgi:hypothetical protein